MSLLRHLVLLLLLFPSLAFADTIGWFFGNTGGTATFSPTTDTLSLTSTITTIIGVGRFGVPIVETGDLGTITVTTGPLISGSILNSGLFDGGTITLNVDVSTGGLLPFTMLGTFNNGDTNTPLLWWTDRFGNHHLVMISSVGIGNINNGEEFVQILDFHQVVVSSGTNQYAVIQGGTTIPEPGTLVLMATGLGLLGWRAKSQQPQAPIA